MRRSAAIAGLALACAPAAQLRPASGILPGRDYEIGAGATRISPRPYVDETASGTGQLWFSAELGRPFLVSAIAGFDDTAALAGGALRWQALHGDRVRAGVEVDTGVLWLGGSVPLAVRLFDQSWLYAAPRLSNWGPDLTPFLPVGLDARIIGGLKVRGEAQWSWADFQYFNRRLHLSLAIAQQW